jgi:ribonuclease T2
LLASTFLLAHTAYAQEVHTPPGQFDYYVLNLSWAPDFCNNMKTLTPQERTAAGNDMQCATPQGFVLHGLWPQNFNGSYPTNCSSKPAHEDLERNLDMTPNLALLNHEWAKHGTCTTLSPSTFFATARQAYTSVSIPEEFKVIQKDTELSPVAILSMFYRANNTFPQGSFALSCKDNRLTAIEACFSKDTVQPIACQNIPTCQAPVVKITPQNDDGIIE